MNPMDLMGRVFNGVERQLLVEAALVSKCGDCGFPDAECFCDRCLDCNRYSDRCVCKCGMCDEWKRFCNDWAWVRGYGWEMVG